MRQITEKGGLAKAIGVTDAPKIWVFERVSANCPPIKRERGDNSAMTVPKNIEHPTPNAERRRKGREPSIRCWAFDVRCSMFLISMQFKFLRYRAQYKNYIWNPKKVQYWRGDLGTEIFLFRFWGLERPLGLTGLNHAVTSLLPGRVLHDSLHPRYCTIM